MSKPKDITRTVYPYHMDTRGDWWTVNPQRGWVRVPSDGRALLATLAGAVL